MCLCREEELIYLEFLSTVTEDILSRGFISDGFDILMTFVSPPRYVD